MVDPCFVEKMQDLNGDFANREVAHYVLLSHNVNMQRIGLTFILREIFDLAHYNVCVMCIQKNVHSHVYSKNILNLTKHLSTVNIKYISVPKRDVDTFFHFYPTTLLSGYFFHPWCLDGRAAGISLSWLYLRNNKV